MLNSTLFSLRYLIRAVKYTENLRFLQQNVNDFDP